jgi:hypothetical protein
VRYLYDLTLNNPITAEDPLLVGIPVEFDLPCFDPQYWFEIRFATSTGTGYTLVGENHVTVTGKSPEEIETLLDPGFSTSRCIENLFACADEGQDCTGSGGTTQLIHSPVLITRRRVATPGNTMLPIPPEPIQLAPITH